MTEIRCRKTETSSEGDKEEDERQNEPELHTTRKFS